MFEWDENKRLANIAKHGIDFKSARLIFDGPTLEYPDDRRDYGEPRIGAFGKVEGAVIFVVYTWRGRKRRIISARKAATHEAKIYQTQIAAQGTEPPRRH